MKWPRVDAINRPNAETQISNMHHVYLIETTALVY